MTKGPLARGRLRRPVPGKRQAGGHLRHLRDREEADAAGVTFGRS